MLKILMLEKEIILSSIDVHDIGKAITLKLRFKLYFRGIIEN